MIAPGTSALTPRTSESLTSDSGGADSSCRASTSSCGTLTPSATPAAAAPGAIDRFRAAYALLGAQRSLRIMGIFTRLAQRDGKRRYLAFMPRVWDAIQRDLAHPALAPLAAALEGVPAPSARVTDRIAQA